jgi:hypothetical protein
MLGLLRSIDERNGEAAAAASATAAGDTTKAV